MEFQSMEKIARLSRNCIITEKIDGTNAQIHILPLNPTTNISKDFKERGWAVVQDGSFIYGVVPGSKNREIKPGKKDNYGFAQWVLENAEELLQLGPGRHFGEWWGQGIQRGYDMIEKRFSLFNVSRWKDNVNLPKCCNVVPVLGEGLFHSNLIEHAMATLEMYGSQANKGFMKPEGVVVFHTAKGFLFKKTIENDEGGKTY